MRMNRLAGWGLGLACWLCVASVQAEGPAAAADAGVANKPSKKKKSKSSPPPSAAEAEPAPAKPPVPVVSIKPAPPPTAAGSAKPPTRTATVPAKPTPPPSAAKAGPSCSIEEPEQPRGGRLEVIGKDFGEAPVVRIAERPARMLERRSDRISVQVPADSNGGAVTLQSAGHSTACGNLTIIGKNR